MMLKELGCLADFFFIEKSRFMMIDLIDSGFFAIINV